MFVDARIFCLGICLILDGCSFSAVDFSPVVENSGESAFYVGAPHIVAQRDARWSREILRSSDGLFYTDALVNGVPVRFVVDSGSSLVVFSGKDADRVNLARSTHSLDVRTASGATRMQGVTVKNLEIEGRSLAQVEAVVAEDMSGASLLGQSALSQLDAVNFSGDRLELH